VSRTSTFWLGRLALTGLIYLGLLPASGALAAPAPPAPSDAANAGGSAQAGARKQTTASQQKKRAPKRAYSARRSRTRQAQLAEARAAARAREIAEAVVPRYKVDPTGALVPDVHAAAAIIYDPESGQVLWEENSQTQRSIASITKVMTAVVFLEDEPDLTKKVTIKASDVLRASTTFLRQNDRVTADDLLHLLLIASDNAAARALARVSPGGAAAFVGRMNEKAAELGLESTHYADPSGLLSTNISSAYDMARLIAHASGNERIASIMRTPTHTIETARRQIAIRSTNHLLGQEDLDVLAGKTGFISKAGYCLATLLRLPKSDHQVAVVILGARSSAGRFAETRYLFNWLSNKASSFFATNTSAASAVAAGAAAIAPKD
jgi:D-alanyl-D-alanine endopeptidase (penicillin-binding protein 7)